MSDLLQLLLAGASTGAVYALIAMGFVIVFKATNVVNFAHAAVVMLGSWGRRELTSQSDDDFLVLVDGPERGGVLPRLPELKTMFGVGGRTGRGVERLC